MLEQVSCNLCQSKAEKVFLTEGSYRLVMCRNCCLVYRNPRPPEEELDKIYTQEYYQSQNSLKFGYDNYLQDKENIFRTFQRRLRKIEKFVKKGTLLDIGCALGFFMNAAKEKGWQCFGVEISDYAAHYARDELGLKVFTGKLGEAKFPGEAFDLVTMWDLIEHLPDPLRELKEANRVLKPNGLIVITTPNLNSIPAKITRRGWLGFTKLQEHLYYFSDRTLKQMLEKAQFTVLRIENIGKVCSFALFINRLHHYDRPLAAGLSFFVDKLRLWNLSFYVNPYDMMAVYAGKQ